MTREHHHQPALRYINGVVDKAVKKKPRTENLTVSDKIDQFVTNRILALRSSRSSCG